MTRHNRKSFHLCQYLNHTRTFRTILIRSISLNIDNCRNLSLPDRNISGTAEINLPIVFAAPKRITNSPLPWNRSILLEWLIILFARRILIIVFLPIEPFCLGKQKSSSRDIYYPRQGRGLFIRACSLN